MTPVSLNAYAGVQRAFATATQAARDLSTAFVAPASSGGAASVRTDRTVNAIIKLNEAETSLKANVAVARTADRMTGTLLDLLA